MTNSGSSCLKAVSLQTVVLQLKLWRNKGTKYASIEHVFLFRTLYKKGGEVWRNFFHSCRILEYQSSLLVPFYHTRPESFENTKILAWLLCWGEIWISLGFKLINWHVDYNVIK